MTSAHLLTRVLPILVTSLLAPACTSELETAATEQEVAKIALTCGGAGFRVLSNTSQWPANVVDGGIEVHNYQMSKTPGYSEKVYDTREAAELDLPEVCESFASAIREEALARAGAAAIARCEATLFSAFTCEECENGAGPKCEQEIREGSCQWRPGAEPQISVSPGIREIAPPRDTGVRQVVSPLPVIEVGPAPGTKYGGDCFAAVVAAARITDNLVGCGEPNSCD